MIINIKPDELNNIESILNFTDFHQKKDINLQLQLNNPNFICPSCLTVLAAYINYLDSFNDLKKRVYSLDKQYIENYLKRINFYKVINHKVNDSNIRNNLENNLLEITRIDIHNDSSYASRAINIIKNRCEIDDGVKDLLDYSINEIICNIGLHANSKDKGYISLQYFPTKKEIIITCVDTGIGIFKSLTKNPNYENLDEKESIKKCLEKEVGEGNGRGMGLYETKKFIKANGGEMKIISGNSLLTYPSKYNKVIDKWLDLPSIDDIKYWQGTIVYLKIKTDVPMSFSKTLERENNGGYKNIDLDDWIGDF